MNILTKLLVKWLNKHKSYSRLDVDGIVDMQMSP